MSTMNPLMPDSGLPVELRALLDTPDGAAFEQALDAMVRQREQRLFRALGQLARDLHDAVRRLGGELAQDGVPGAVADARQQLQDVLEMSAAAAHCSLDFAERLRPQAEALSQHAAAVLAQPEPGAATPLAQQAATFADDCSKGLADMVLAQSWQDLTGQRITKVSTFIGTVESSLLELVRLTGALAGGEVAVSVAHVASQDDADRLLSEFGF